MRATLEKRFWARVKKGDGCWLWSGSKTPKGYGYIDGVPVHRVSWELCCGSIPAGLCVLHRCDVRHCVRPDHLFIGTKQDNSSDMVAKGRSTWGEKNPTAKLSEDDVLSILDMLHDGIRQPAVAHMFGVSRSNISCIWTGKSWQHVGCSV